MLSERRQKILQFIIDDYVNTAQPVGSGTIVQKYGLPVSSATIRHEMALLEEEGYITQPHTSAGRIPTDRGYRFYVEALMREETLPPEVQDTIRRRFHEAARELEEWARLAAAVLAGQLQSAAVVSPPHTARPRPRWLELVAVQDYLTLLLVVLQEARVLQHTLEPDRRLSQDELTVIARRLTDIVGGKTAAEIRALPLELAPFERAILQATTGLLESAEEAGPEASFLEGLRELIRQPEFTQGERIVELLELLDERNLPRAIPLPPAVRGEVKIVIGGEHPVDVMRRCSVITIRYTGPSGLSGMLGVVGPTRMHYPRAVSTVRYVSSLMEDLLRLYFG